MFAWFMLLSLGAILGRVVSVYKDRCGGDSSFYLCSDSHICCRDRTNAIHGPAPESWPNLRQMWLPFLAMGITNGVLPYTLITWGELYISSSLAAILTAAMPLFTVLTAHWLTRDERLTPNKGVGNHGRFRRSSFSFLPDLSQGLQTEFWGDLAVVGAAASYGLATTIAHKFVHGVSHTAAAAGQLASASLIMIPLSLAFDNPFGLAPSALALGAVITLPL